MPERERLVGRDVELDRLASLIASDRAVVVVGEAGIGKSSLIHEAVAADGREGFAGGGLATLSWMPYLAIERATGMHFTSGDPISVAAAVERALGPGILVLDDLQWADRATLAVVPVLAGRMAVVTAVRSGDADAEAVLEALAGAGFERLDVPALDVRSAAALLRRRAPHLVRAQLEAIVRRCGGNPLLLNELSTGSEPSADLRLAIEARLRRLSPRARMVFGLLAIAAHPISLRDVQDEAAELVAAELATVGEDGIAARHALIGETYLQTLTADERRSLHATLAERLQDPGEVARHHAAAGSRAAAHRAAMTAFRRAGLPGERADHLELAAEMVDPQADHELRIRAAQALGDVGAHARAVALTKPIISDVPVVQAELALIRARAAWADGDDATLAEACRTGLGLAGGTDSEVELRLRVTCARAALDSALMHQGDRTAARDEALQATALAERLGRHRAEAREALGMTKLVNREPGWREHLRRSVEAARTAREVSTEFRAGGTLAFGLLIEGHPDEARIVALELAERARVLGLLGGERSARALALGAMWHSSGPAAVIDAAEDLVAEATDVGDQLRVAFYTCQAYVDAGRLEEARELADSLVARAHPSWEDLGNALWCRTDVEFWSGRPRQALLAADDALDRFGRIGPTSFLQVTRAWALLDLGRPPDGAPEEDERPIIAGAIPEVAALRSLGAGDHGEAARLFRQAADAWSGRHLRGEVRSGWGEGEALRRDGQTALAIDRLVEVEARAEQLGFVPMLGRMRRSLRLLGVRRSAPRRVVADLTGREHQLLELAAAGQTSAQIARRLGVGRPTVDRIIASAMLKLGAETRAQAVALAAQR